MASVYITLTGTSMPYLLSTFQWRQYTPAARITGQWYQSVFSEQGLVTWNWLLSRRKAVGSIYIKIKKGPPGAAIGTGKYARIHCLKKLRKARSDRNRPSLIFWRYLFFDFFFFVLLLLFFGFSISPLYQAAKSLFDGLIIPVLINIQSAESAAVSSGMEYQIINTTD